MPPIWKTQAKIIVQPSGERRRAIIKNLLKNRGLVTKKEQEEFLHPPQPDSYSWRAVRIKKTEVAKAVKRINQALAKQELIYIYGDYDTDGITATAVIWETLHNLGGKVMPYIPTRSDDTRGLSPSGIKEIIKSSLKKFNCRPALIITVDNGISAFKGCQYARQQGIEVIISDHHQPRTKSGKLIYPDALGIVHTTAMAGAGVAWLFSQAIVNFQKKHSLSFPSLELAAIGTIADMVPLIGFNRSLVKQGLKELRQTSRLGLQALAALARVDLDTIQAHDISFKIAPRLNSMGRLKTSLDSLRLLCTPNHSRVKHLSQDLDKTNQMRRDITGKMFFHARNQWLKKQKKSSLLPKIIFVSHSSYHEGVVGLVASQLVREFNRPAVVVAITKNRAKASARSIKGFDMIKSFRQMENLFLELGGHQLAAGFSAETKNLSAIQKKLEALASKQLFKEKLQPMINIDCEINLADITWALFNQLEKFQPFGFANLRPVFVTKKLKVISRRSVGKNNKHLKLSLGGTDGGRLIEAIAFNFGYLFSQLNSSSFIDAVYTIEENEWNNKKNLQLKIKDIHL